MDKASPFQIILLVVFGALFAAGIIIFALNSATGGGVSIGSVTIWGTLDESAFNEVIHTASDQDQRLANVTYVQKDPTTFEKDLTEALAAGKGPDLILLRSDWAYYDQAKTQHFSYSKDIPLSQFEDTFIDASSPFLAPDGVIGIPVLADPLVLFWNKDVLAAGGHAVPPSFWDEAISDVRDITKTSDSGEITRSGLNLGGYKNIDDAKDIVTTLIMQAGNPITQVEKNGDLGTVLAAQSGDAISETIDALTFYTEFADPSQLAYTWNESLPEARTMFSNGDLGLYIGHASEALLIAKQNPNLNFAIAALPQIRVGQKYPLTSAIVYALAVTNTSQNKTGARTVASILSSKLLSQQLAEQFSMTSALRTVVSATSTGNQDVFNRASIIAKNWTDPDPEQTDQLFQSMVEDIVSGAAKPQESAQQADKAISALLTPQ